MDAALGGRASDGPVEDLLEPDDPFGDSEGVFRAAPPSSNAESLAMLSRRAPGKLFEQGLTKIKERLLALQGASGATTDQDLRRVLSFYHEVIFKSKNGDLTNKHTEAEMATLAEAVDCLSEGDLGRLGDILLQRYTALERSVTDGNWIVAQEMEVLDHNRSGLASDEQVWRASRRQLHAAQLQRTLEGLTRRPDGSDPSGRRRG